MSRRAISDKSRSWLLGELEVWRAGGLLSEEQAVRILDSYETPAEVAGRKRSTAVFTLMGVAAFLVGLAVLSLIAYNWQNTPKELKLAGNLASIAVTYGLGFALRYRWNARLLSEVAFFLGCLLFGAGIWLVAQVFHIQAHWPNGVWLWALGVLPLALCLDTLLLHSLLASLLAVWVGCEIIGFPHLGTWLFGRWSHVPNGAYSLPLLALPGLVWAYRRQSPKTLALYLAAVAWWAVLQPVAWHASGEMIYFIGAVGALLLVLAESHRTGSEMAIPYRALGVVMCAGVLIPLSFLDFNAHMRPDRMETTGLVVTVGIAAVGMATAALAVLMKPRTGSLPSLDLDSVGLRLKKQWLPIGVILLMAGLSLWQVMFPAPGAASWGRAARWSFSVVLPTILANAAVVAFAVWLMRVGLREDRGRPFAAGVILFVAWAGMRYVDLFGDFGGLLGASLMFFLCGAALFGLAIYWRRRKEVADV